MNVNVRHWQKKPCQLGKFFFTNPMLENVTSKSLTVPEGWSSMVAKLALTWAKSPVGSVP